jgi:uncharacterized protein (TIRG00374 family)
VVLIAAVFGFALPRLASYSRTIDALRSMTGLAFASVVLAALANFVANWYLIMSVLPGLTLRRAATVNLSSTAVANTVPGGGAIATGVSWRMLTGWGVTSSDFAVYLVTTGVWSALGKLATPGLALLVVALSGQNHSGPGQIATLWTATLLSTGIFVLAVVLLLWSLRAEQAAQAIDRLAHRAVRAYCRLLRRPPPGPSAGMAARFRDDVRDLLHRRGRHLTLATIASDLGWLVVLQTSLWACGVPASQVSWERCLVGFALARLISTVPITPGGLGVIELGLVAYLASGLGADATARVTAAVLLTRAMTYVLPIPLGGATYLGWHVSQQRRRQLPDS